MSIAAMIIVITIILSIVGSTNYYVARRLYQWLSIFITQTNAKIFAALYLFLTMLMILGFIRSFLPIPSVIKSILNWISSYWMGISLYLFMFILLADVVLLIGGLIKIIPKPIPQNVLFWKGLIALVLATSIVCYGAINAAFVKHVSYGIQLKNVSLGNIKVVILADLHLGSASQIEKNLGKIVQDINDLEPDIVCLIGDIFNDDYKAIRNPAAAIESFKGIDSKHGVYACLGNHDGGSTLSQMMHFLEECNIILLNDEHVIVDNRFVLIGRLDHRPIGSIGELEKKRRNITDILASINTDMPIIVMDHDPLNIKQYGNEVDLILAGHTHRGQVYPGNLITRAMYIIDYGHYQKDADSPHVIVTSGASTWGPPLRIGTNNEIVTIILQ